MSGGVRDHIVLLLLVLARPVVQLSVKLAAVQILDEVPDLANCPHVRVLGEEIHVAEGVNGDQGEIILGLAEMVERMSGLDPIRSLSPNCSFLTRSFHSLTLHVVSVVEQDDKGQTLLSVFKSNLQDQELRRLKILLFV